MLSRLMVFLPLVATVETSVAWAILGFAHITLIACLYSHVPLKEKSLR